VLVVVAVVGDMAVFVVHVVVVVTVRHRFMSATRAVRVVPVLLGLHVQVHRALVPVVPVPVMGVTTV
jgi:hypothetical protein